MCCLSQEGGPGGLRPLVAGHWSKLLAHPPRQTGCVRFEPELGGLLASNSHHWKDDWFPEYSGVTMRFLSSFHRDRHARQAYRPCIESILSVSDSKNEKVFLLAVSALDFGLFCPVTLWQTGYQVSCVSVVLVAGIQMLLNHELA